MTCCNTSELVHTGRRCSIQVSAGQGTLRGCLQPPSPARNPPGRTVHAPGRAPARRAGASAAPASPAHPVNSPSRCALASCVTQLQPALSPNQTSLYQPTLTPGPWLSTTSLKKDGSSQRASLGSPRTVPNPAASPLTPSLRPFGSAAGLCSGTVWHGRRALATTGFPKMQPLERLPRVCAPSWGGDARTSGSPSLWPVDARLRAARSPHSARPRPLRISCRGLLGPLRGSCVPQREALGRGCPPALRSTCSPQNGTRHHAFRLETSEAARRPPSAARGALAHTQRGPSGFTRAQRW